MSQRGAVTVAVIGLVTMAGCAANAASPSATSAPVGGDTLVTVTVTVTVTASPMATPTPTPTAPASAVVVDWDSGRGTPESPAPDPSPSGWYEAAFGSPPDGQGKVLYLTLDDGPGISTRDTLDVLAANDAKATFFVVGTQAAASPDTIAAIKAAGHAVGTHTWDHADLTTLSAPDVRQELETTAQAAGSGPCMRPPYGNIDAASGSESVDLRLQPILWTAQAYDWKQSATTAQIVSDIKARTAPGAVVLLHDGGGDRSKTVEALRELLPYWKSQGYQLKPVPACL